MEPKAEQISPKQQCINKCFEENDICRQDVTSDVLDCLAKTYGCIEICNTNQAIDF